jgi:cyanophycinase
MSTKLPLVWKILSKIKWPRSSPVDKTRKPRQAVWQISRRRMVFWIGSFLMTVGVGVYLRAEIDRRISRFTDRHPIYQTTSGGTLLVVGGGPLSEMIRHRFVELAGGKNARIVVIPAAIVDDYAMTQYRESWMKYDVASVDVLQAESRTQADDPDFSRVLETATGVWLGGGQQTVLSGWYGRTLVETRLKDLLTRNGVIGGTSAGAAIMSSVMIAGGQQSPRIARGFDLIPGAIIDQHFVKRNRVRRLQAALEQHPELIGFGIDEGTALQYAVESGHFQVIGQSCVVAFVPRREQNRTEFHMEFFNPGDDFDVERLRQREPVPPNYVDFDSVLMGE